ncbi:hypothetical protein BOTBODRAFT_176062 [Botryobasidium botryosum FD-172 SS1]|uniref:Protein byr4 n=1 Tax=Botryobasidium botryosum (strain FD-172 SS1) TaxID=930990 RepID=A0A067MBJ9_BOTB1|nr:hypothetical protein BOTBODRAFT_176062 [Botryobasidium botryosum FD-172 SS1]
MTSILPLVPAPSPQIREEWPDADFDLPEGHSIFDQAPDSDNDESIHSSSSKAGPRIQEEEEEDWDLEFAPQPKPSLPSSAPLTFTGTVTRLGSNPKLSVEVWDDDLDAPLLPKLPVKPQSADDEPNWDADDDDDEGGNASTIKVSRLQVQLSAGLVPATAPSDPSPSTPPSTSVPFPSHIDDSDDIEDAFALPTDLDHLSLRPLPHRLSKPSLDSIWDTTTSYSSEGASSFGFSRNHASPATSAEFDTLTDDSSDVLPEDPDTELEGLLLPDSLLPADLLRILDTKKKAQAAHPPLIVGDTGRKKTYAQAVSPDDDFEIGLCIGDDSELSPTRLRSFGLSRGTRGTYNPVKPKKPGATPPRGSAYARPPSRTRTHTAPAVSSVSTASGPLRAKSPGFTSLRSRPTTSFRHATSATSIFPPVPTPTPPPARALTLTGAIPPPTSSHHHAQTSSASSNSSLLVPRPPSAMKHQKSASRLQSPTSTIGIASSGTGASGGVGGPRRLLRKASLSGLPDEYHRTYPATSGGASGSGAGTVSGGSGSGSAGYDAPTASSRARQHQQPQHHLLERNLVPPTRPSTPSASTAALRLTMPTSSSRLKARAPITNIFPASPAVATHPRALSPIPSSHPHSSSDTRPPSSSSTSTTTPTPTASPFSPFSASGSGTGTGAKPAAVRVLRKPRKARVYGDGTELDWIEDLSVEREKERRFTVDAKDRSGVAGMSANTSASGNAGERRRVSGSGSSSGSLTIGKRVGLSASNAGTTAGTKRPGSSASNYSNIIEPPKYPASSLRHKARIDFSTAKPSSQRQLQLQHQPSHSQLQVQPQSRHSTVSAPLDNLTVNTASTPRRKKSNRKKPTLIRNLGGAGAPKVVGDMKWNPGTLRWEGNDSVLRDFESHANTFSRPALITHLTGTSSVGALGSPTGFASGARVVGNMLFDPSRMCWVSRHPEEEEVDVFAGLDEEDEEDAKGGTIRAILKVGEGNAHESPSRAGSLSQTHTRTGSESETESVSASSRRGSFGGVSARESMGSVMTLDEGSIPDVDEELLKASRAAEERHRSEMKGWVVSLGRKRGGDVSAALREREPDRGYLFDIRALATRKY